MPRALSGRQVAFSPPPPPPSVQEGRQRGLPFQAGRRRRGISTSQAILQLGQPQPVHGSLYSQPAPPISLTSLRQVAMKCLQCLKAATSASELQLQAQDLKCRILRQTKLYLKKSSAFPGQEVRMRQREMVEQHCCLSMIRLMKHSQLQ